MATKIIATSRNDIKSDLKLLISYAEELKELRVANAKKRLLMTGLPVGEIGRSVGYPDSNYFVKVFKRSTGLTPSEYREKNGDER